MHNAASGAWRQEPACRCGIMGARPANDILHAYLVSTRSVWIKPVEEALQLDCQMLQQLCLVVLCSQ